MMGAALAKIATALVLLGWPHRSLDRRSRDQGAIAWSAVQCYMSAMSYQDNYNGRVDHNFGTKATVSGRYVFNDTYEAGIPFWGHDERNNLGRSQNVCYQLHAHAEPVPHQ